MGNGSITKREFGGTYRKTVRRKNASWWYMVAGFRDLPTIPIVKRSLTRLSAEQTGEGTAQAPSLVGRLAGRLG